MRQKFVFAWMVVVLILLFTHSTVSAAGFQVAGNSNTDQFPAVAYNSSADEYLVVWEYEFSTTDHDIYARKVSADGSLVGSQISIATSTKFESSPAVTFSPSTGEYLVVWQRLEGSDEFTQNDIWGQRVASSGTLAGSAFAISTLSTDETSPDICSNPSNSEYLVAWDYRYNATDHDIYAQRLSSSGSKTGSLITVAGSTRDELNSSVAYATASQHYFIVWQKKQADTSAYNIFGRIYQNNGTAIGGETAIATWDHDLIKARVAYNSNANEFLVVWEDHRWGFGAARDIYGQRVSGDGGPEGGNFGISWEGSNYRLSPGVAFNPSANEYLVVWEYEYNASDHDVYCGRVGSGGVLIETDLPVSKLGSTEVRPVVASGGTLSYLVAWEDGRNVSTQEMDVYGDLFHLYRLSGWIYAGDVGDESSPLGEVTVGLYCSNDANQLGDLIASQVTNEDGWYGLLCSGGCEYFNIQETDLQDYISKGATTVDGTVINENWIQYSFPLLGKTLTGNKFWDLADPPPGNWVNFAPFGWVETRTLDCSVEVQDIGSGLHVSTAQYCYSTDGGGSWSSWLFASCTGSDGTTEVQRITAGSVSFGQDSGVSNLNLIRFRISDMTGHLGESDPYGVHIDTASPEITSGPEISEITESSVLISWTTSEAADSLVRYGRTAGDYPLENMGTARVTTHGLTLSDLEPSSTYHLFVRSTDVSGKPVESRELTFKTAALPDDVNPTVSIVDPGVCEGVVTISADASDNTGVEKVEFFLDDELVFTSYSSGYEFSLDTLKLENGQHLVAAKVYDLAGRTQVDQHQIDVSNFVDAETPQVHIYYPSNGSTVAGQVNVGVTAQDDSGWSEVEWFVDGNKLGGGKYPIAQSQPLDIRFWWDTRFLENKGHRLAVKATDDSGKSGLDYVDVYVSNTSSPSKPDLIIEKHELFRHGHTFAVELTVKNQGTATAHNIKISDFMKAFQPISRANFNGADYTAGFDSSKMEGECTIKDSVSLNPGSSRMYSFAIIPVMIHPNPPNPSLGYKIKLSYEAHIPYTVTYQREKQFYVSKTTWTAGAAPAAPIATAYDDALKESDYLIVTNPALLFFHNPFQQNEVNELLSDMAQLAFNKKGALGYLTTSNRNTLRNLIQSNGAWAQKLHPDFRATAKGYLLLVGEIEIIPAWNSGSVWNITYTNSKCVTREVRNSDLPYANTGGNNEAPELIVGRIIGNTAADLVRAIQTSNCVYAHCQGYGFDRSDAFLVSGIDGDTDIQKMFTKFVDDVEQSIKTEFSVKKLHWKDITATQRVPQFRGNTSDKDVITYQGHGSPDGWGPLGTADVTGNPSATPPVPGIDFGSTNPLVLAWACLTGSYEDHTANSPCSFDGGDDNIAEAFLDRGAAVYIGATEVSEIGRNSIAGKEFSNKYWKPQTTAGKALTDIKRNNWSQSDAYWQLWVWEYNLYGDPKFGAVPAGSPSSGPQLASESPGGPPSTSLDIEVPDYGVEIANGYHYVDIPGGTLLLKNGEYRIPYYTKSIDYPVGVRVQDVIMTYRSDPITEGGFNLPIHLNALAEPGKESGVHPEDGEGWYPEKDYDWKVIINPDGSSTVIIIMYPFKYNGTTKDVLFYKNYSFEINDIPSPVRILNLNTDKNEYSQGETITVHAGITNEGDQQTVIFGAVVKRCGSEEVVDSLLLHTLEQFTGEASFSAEWISENFEPGCYFVQTTLKDAAGNVLDIGTTMFNIGISSGEVTQFRASPDYFSPGDHISITMQFINTGTVDFNGTAIIRIVSENGENVHEFKHVISVLSPGNSTELDDVWETAYMEEGTYRIVGYVLYRSKSSDPVTAMVSTLPPCPGNFDIDSDVDGSDLAELADDPAHLELGEFVAGFGRTDCPH